MPSFKGGFQYEYALGTQFQNKGTRTSPARLSFVLKVSLRNLGPSVIYSVPCDQIVQRAYLLWGCVGCGGVRDELQKKGLEQDIGLEFYLTQYLMLYPFKCVSFLDILEIFR